MYQGISKLVEVSVTNWYLELYHSEISPFGWAHYAGIILGIIGVEKHNALIQFLYFEAVMDCLK